MGRGWRDGNRHPVGGFWLVTSSKPQPSAEHTAQAAPPKDMRETPSARETLTRMGVTWTTIISVQRLIATIPVSRSSFAGRDGLEAVMDRRGDVGRP